MVTTWQSLEGNPAFSLLRPCNLAAELQLYGSKVRPEQVTGQVVVGAPGGCCWRGALAVGGERARGGGEVEQATVTRHWGSQEAWEVVGVMGREADWGVCGGSWEGRAGGHVAGLPEQGRGRPLDTRSALKPPVPAPAPHPLPSIKPLDSLWCQPYLCCISAPTPAAGPLVPASSPGGGGRGSAGSFEGERLFGAVCGLPRRATHFRGGCA